MRSSPTEVSCHVATMLTPTKGSLMEWEKPRIVVIEMAADIGAYQGDLIDDPLGDAPEPYGCDIPTPDARPADVSAD